MRCGDCKAWWRGGRTTYSDGTVLESERKPFCRTLNMETDAEFGCAKFEQIGSPDEQLAIEQKDGTPWQNWTMVGCPDCQGKGSADAACNRCAGTGNVRRYDDGFVGDEQTRRHPKEGDAAAVVDPGTVLTPIEEPNPTEPAATV